MQNLDASALKKRIQRVSLIGINDGVTSFAEKPSNEFAPINKETDLKSRSESIDAYSLFSMFTAEIILQKAVFVR